MPGLIITASPGLTVVTSGPAVSTTPAPSDPRMWGNWRSPGRPRTTNKSRWLSAAARMATRTSRPPSRAGEPGAGTSATSIRSRPPVSRMRQARMMPRLSDTMTGASRAEWLRAVLWPECEQHDAPLAHSYHGERTLPFEGGAAVQPAAEQQRIGVAESGHPRHLARVRAGLELEGGPPLDPGDRFAGHAVRNGV